MIESFGNRLAEDVFYDRRSKDIRAFPTDLLRAARREILYRHDGADLTDPRAPSGHRVEALKGQSKGMYSIRINHPWCLSFPFERGTALDVAIVDDHSAHPWPKSPIRSPVIRFIPAKCCSRRFWFQQALPRPH